MFNETQLLPAIDAFIEANGEAIFRDVKTLVDIDSVQTAPAPGAPFGPGVRKAMDAALCIARGFGLSVRDCEGRMAYAEVPGASEKQIATAKSLGLKRVGDTTVQPDNAATAGKINTISHMVEFVKA